MSLGSLLEVALLLFKSFTIAVASRIARTLVLGGSSLAGDLALVVGFTKVVMGVTRWQSTSPRINSIL
jgi:hypothetical protein